MTDEEKENMKLTIEVAMLKFSKDIADALNTKIEYSITQHSLSCLNRPQNKVSGKPKSKAAASIAEMMGDWRTIIVALAVIVLTVTTAVSTIRQPAALDTKQVQQIVKEIQNIGVPPAVPGKTKD